MPIVKPDADGTVVHIHTLRHSFRTHLSTEGNAPRLAQGVGHFWHLQVSRFCDAELVGVRYSSECQFCFLMKIENRV